MTIEEELKKIAEKHDGLLNPVDVVEFAKNPKTELHSKFTWDDTKAAEQYRLWQARELIIHVTIIPQKDQEPIRAYVSLSSDRGEGGYRSIIDVLVTPKLRRTMLDEALAEFERWEAKYSQIKELAEIFVAAKTVKQKRELMDTVQTATASQ